MNGIISELAKFSDDSKQIFGQLSAEQLNWKANAESWSVGQCFEHLIKSNELYFQEFDHIASGKRQNSFWENWSPFSGFFGKFIANGLKKDSQKIKTIPNAVPPSEIEANIIEQFVTNQAVLIEKIRAMQNANWFQIKLTSPFLKVATYNLNDAFQIIIEHEKRHFRQAERVLHTQGFPI